MTLTAEAREWGRKWYEKLWTQTVKESSDSQVQGYLARKQGHLVKLALVLSISESDAMQITDRHMQLAEIMLGEAEATSSHVFSRIGRSEDSLQAERLLDFIKKYGKVEYTTAYRYVHDHFPDARAFEGILAGLMRSGMIKLDMSESSDPGKARLVYTGPIA
jgi:hypothetical protein